MTQTPSTHYQASWRVSCAFSLLAAVCARELAITRWTIPGPTGALVEYVLKSLGWVYILAVSLFALYIGYRAYQAAENIRQKRFALLAQGVGVTALLLVYYCYTCM